MSPLLRTGGVSDGHGSSELGTRRMIPRSPRLLLRLRARLDFGYEFGMLSNGSPAQIGRSHLRTSHDPSDRMVNARTQVVDFLVTRLGIVDVIEEARDFKREFGQLPPFLEHVDNYLHQ